MATLIIEACTARAPGRLWNTQTCGAPLGMDIAQFKAKYNRPPHDGFAQELDRLVGTIVGAEAGAPRPPAAVQWGQAPDALVLRPYKRDEAYDDRVP